MEASEIRNAQRIPLFCPVHLSLAQILAHKGGRSQRHRLHGQEHHLVDLAVCGPSGHEIRAEMVDVGLDKNI